MPTEQEIAAAKAAEEAEAKAKADAEAEAKAEASDEDITIKKSELEKIKSDRDNYREGLLKKKTDERTLDKEKDKGGSGSTIDEAKVAEIAKAQVSAGLAETHKSNENRAKLLISKKYNELIDDANWAGFISHFTGKRGKATVEDIMDDFEDSMLLYKRQTGKLEEHLKAERERGRREGFIESNLDKARDAGGAGDKNDGGKSSGFSTLKGEEMARGMHVDPEKAKKVDVSKDNVINV